MPKSNDHRDPVRAAASAALARLADLATDLAQRVADDDATPPATVAGALVQAERIAKGLRKLAGGK